MLKRFRGKWSIFWPQQLEQYNFVSAHTYKWNHHHHALVYVNKFGGRIFNASKMIVGSILVNITFQTYQINKLVACLILIKICKWPSHFQRCDFFFGSEKKLYRYFCTSKMHSVSMLVVFHCTAHLVIVVFFSIDSHHI